MQARVLGNAQPRLVPLLKLSFFLILTLRAAPPAQRWYPASRSKSTHKSHACSAPASSHREQLSVATAASRQSRHLNRKTMHVRHPP